MASPILQTWVWVSSRSWWWTGKPGVLQSMGLQRVRHDWATFIFNLSQHQSLFQWVSSSHQMTKVLENQLQHQSFQWIFRTSFLWDLLLWSPCSPRDSQESSPTKQFKASILQHSAFFIVQLSHPYMTTRKTVALTRWTFIGNVISLIFNMLSRLVIAFLPRSKCLFISRLQSPSAVILEPPRIKSDTVYIVSPCIFHGVMGPDAMILVFWMLF